MFCIFLDCNGRGYLFMYTSSALDHRLLCCWLLLVYSQIENWVAAVSAKKVGGLHVLVPGMTAMTYGDDDVHYASQSVTHSLFNH